MNFQLMKKFHHSNIIAGFTAIKMTIAAIIAFLLVEIFHLPEGVWSLVTIAAVAQAGLSPTLTKLLMRTIGTVLGALIGYFIAVYAKNDITTLILLTFFVIWVSSYIALQPTIYSYAGIVTGLTIAIIVFFTLGKQSITDIAVYRTFEVLLGVLVIGFVNFILYQRVKHFPSEVIVRSTLSWRLPDHRIHAQYAIPAAKVAIACMITFLIWYHFQQPEGYWATVTCLLIMEENQKITFKKGFLRFFSHIAAAAIGLLCVIPLLHASYAWRLIPLVIAFAGCGWLIGKRNQYSSMGNTIGIAIAIMLLTNPQASETIQIIIERFYNVIIGIAVAFVMLIPFEKSFLKKNTGNY